MEDRGASYRRSCKSLREKFVGDAILNFTEETTNLIKNHTMWLPEFLYRPLSYFKWRQQSSFYADTLVLITHVPTPWCSDQHNFKLERWHRQKTLRNSYRATMSTHPKISTTLCLHSSSAKISMLLSDSLLTHNLKRDQQVSKEAEAICRHGHPAMQIWRQTDSWQDVHHSNDFWCF